MRATIRSVAAAWFNACPSKLGPQHAQLPAGQGEPRLLGITIDLRS